MRSMSAELARDALEAAPDAMIIIDADGVVRFANRQTSLMFGYPYEELIGRELAQLLPERVRAIHAEHRRNYWRHLRARPMGTGLELQGRRRNGEEFPVEVSLSPLQDGERVLVAAAIRDVTERKRIEMAIIDAQRSAEQARALADEARQQADRANQGKSRFLATASHDLRQPLQTLALLNGTLRRIVRHQDAAAAIAQQEMAIGAMARLLNALLDISKLESGAVKPEPTDFAVAALFEEMRREFAEIAARKGLELQVKDGDEAVRSDPSLVEQILRNLVSNAIKYTRAGLVRLSALPQGALVRVEVLDTGIGIPADQLPYIYDEFYQIGSAHGALREGYGLGLSIVQRLVKLLDVRLEVHSEVGKGSSFALELPASAVHAASRAAGLAPRSGRAGQRATRPRVLLVEDDPAVLDATRLLLRVEGYQVTTAASLAQALQAAGGAEGPDVVVADYHLGGNETGTQVIGALRERLGAGLPAVLTTGDTSQAVRELPRDARLRLASKPIRADELLALLQELLGA